LKGKKILGWAVKKIPREIGKGGKREIPKRKSISWKVGAYFKKREKGRAKKIHKKTKKVPMV